MQKREPHQLPKNMKGKHRYKAKGRRGRPKKLYSNDPIGECSEDFEKRMADPDRKHNIAHLGRGYRRDSYWKWYLARQIGKRIKLACKYRGCYLTDLADWTGMTTTMINYIVNAKIVPSLAHTALLAAILEVSMDWLLGWVDDEGSNLLAEDRKTREAHISHAISMFRRLKMLEGVKAQKRNAIRWEAHNRTDLDHVEATPESVSKATPTTETQPSMTNEDLADLWDEEDEQFEASLGEADLSSWDQAPPPSSVRLTKP